MVHDEDGDDFFWFQGIGWGKGKILKEGEWINEAVTITVQKGDKDFNLLVLWIRASLYYQKNFSEIEKESRTLELLWIYVGDETEVEVTGN